VLDGVGLQWAELTWEQRSPFKRARGGVRERTVGGPSLEDSRNWRKGKPCKPSARVRSPDPSGGEKADIASPLSELGSCRQRLRHRRRHAPGLEPVAVVRGALLDDVLAAAAGARFLASGDAVGLRPRDVARGRGSAKEAVDRAERIDQVGVRMSLSPTFSSSL